MRRTAPTAAERGEGPRALTVDLSFTARNVLLGATLLGTLGGVLGCFALLRRQSLLGDALAHAALPGVCLAFLLTGTKDPLPLALGAFAAGLVGALMILGVVRWSRIKEDAGIGIVLSVFFGLGIVLLTYIQRLPVRQPERPRQVPVRPGRHADGAGHAGDGGLAPAWSR